MISWRSGFDGRKETIDGLRPRIGHEHTANDPNGSRPFKECPTCLYYHYWGEPPTRMPKGYETSIGYAWSGPYFQQVRKGPDDTFVVIRTMWRDPTVVILA